MSRSQRSRLFPQLVLSWSSPRSTIFPWRETSSPYLVLIAELLLQRTRAEQVAPVYNIVTSRWPDTHSLSIASEDELRSEIKSLGLAYRAKRILDIVKELCAKHNCEVPHDYSALSSLFGKGLGDYVCHAVLCFGFGDRDAIVDSNIIRIFSRVFSLQLNANAHRNREVWQLARSLLPRRSGCKNYNWALLDLGAMICTPRNPHCPDCPLLQICDYGRSRRTTNSAKP